MNKTPALAGLFFTLILLTHSTQAAETQKPPPKTDFLKAVDKNNDGKASKAEFIAAMEKKFSSMDVDKSEAVSVQELKLYGEKDQEARKKAQQAAKQTVRLEKITSKKNFITLFTNRAEREFAVLDKNKDSQLSADEIGVNKAKPKKRRKAKTPVEKYIAKADFVALFSASAEQDFGTLDKNRDGKLTDSELGIKPKAKANPIPKATAKPASPSLPAAIASKQTPVSGKKAQQQKLIKSFFAGIDANNDGQISPQEKNAVFERLFNRLDTNHDKAITTDEIIAGRHAPLANQP